MRWTNWRKRYRAKKQWHRWFAWHPVAIGQWYERTDQTVWWCWVDRKIGVDDPDLLRPRYDYRLPDEEMR